MSARVHLGDFFLVCLLLYFFYSVCTWGWTISQPTVEYGILGRRKIGVHWWTNINWTEWNKLLCCCCWWFSDFQPNEFSHCEFPIRHKILQERRKRERETWQGRIVKRNPHAHRIWIGKSWCDGKVFFVFDRKKCLIEMSWTNCGCHRHSPMTTTLSTMTPFSFSTSCFLSPSASC